MVDEEIKNPCPEFPFFGAPYPDATCIDGYLWDLDKYEDGHLYSTGDNPPCPFCNTELFIENHIDDEGEDGEGMTREKLTEQIEKLRLKYQ